MENVELTDNVFKTKKIFFRKELDVSKVGEKVYSSEIIHQHAVYVLRKFVFLEEYKQVEHFEALIRKIPEQFQQEFDGIFIKDIYRDIKDESVYITLLLTTEQPLNKAQVISIRRWIGQLKVKGLFVAKETGSEEKKISLLLKGLQETNTQVTLLTDIINQLNGDMKNAYQDIQSLKEQKTDSDIIERIDEPIDEPIAEAEQKIEMLTIEVEQVTREFSTFKTSLQKKIHQLSKKSQSREFKLVKGNHDPSIVTAEKQLKNALIKIDELTKKVTQSDEQVTQLKKIVQEKTVRDVAIESTFGKNDSKYKQKKLVADMKATNKKITDITQEMKSYNDKLTTVEESTAKVDTVEEKIADLKNENQTSMAEVNKVVKVVQHLVEQGKKDQQQLRGNSQQISQLIEKITAQNDELKVACQKIDELEQQLSSAKEYQENKKQLQENTDQVKKLTTTIVEFDKKFAQINEKMNQIEKNSLAKNEYKNTQEKLQTNTNEIAKLSIAANTLEDTIEKLQTDLVEVKADSSIKNKIQINNDQIQKLAETTEAFQLKFTETNEKMDELEQKCLNKKESSKTEAQLQSHTTKIKKLVVTTDVLDDQFAKTREELDTLKEKVLTLESEESSLDEDKKKVRNFRNLSEKDTSSHTLIYGNMKSAEFDREMKKFPLKEVLVRNDSLEPTDESVHTFSYKDMDGLDLKNGEQSEGIYIDNFKPNDLSLSHEYAVKELEKLEEKIPMYFDDENMHLIQRGKIKKEDFYPTLRKIEIIPYLWFNIFRKEKKDILIGNALSCKYLVDELANFLDEIESTERKKLIRSKWVHFSKEVEYRIEGYKLFSEYLELYYHVNQSKRA